MKQFFKFMFASMLGTFLATFALFFVGFLIVAGAISAAFSDFDQSQAVTKVKENSILQMNLDRPIVERGPDEVFKLDFGGFSSVSPIGLDQILENIEKAKNDENIEGILLETGFPLAGLATIDQIRDALVDFRSSGKWIISYNELYSQGGFYLATAADEIYLPPNTDVSVSFKGLNADVTFLKRMFDKLEIEMQVVRGANNQFKSAVEPFLYEEMSPSNRMQTEAWLGAIWEHMLEKMSEQMSLDVEELRQLANLAPVHYNDEAVERGLITGTMYQDELTSMLMRKTECEDEDDLEFVSLTSYLKAPAKKSEGIKFTPTYKQPKIAVVYAEGVINLGKGSNETIGADTYVEALNEARRDTSVKAIVLRVNSPGGVAIAGDMIWRETTLAKDVKPVVVSMGDVAASAGYMISANANKIYALPSTITGSIGVFGTIPNAKGFLNNKIGLTFDGVKTNKYADFGDLTRPLTSEEYAILQGSVDRTYDHFVNVVAEGRGLRASYVDSIGQGRVWSGADALALGLVDEIGSLDDAIKAAAELAGVEEEYTIQKLPKRKDPFEQLIEDLTGQTSTMMLRWQLGGDEQLVRQFQELQRIKSMTGVQALMPYRFELH